MSNWTRQEDGTHLPSAELVNKIRANRAQYPDAVKDFAQVTGKTEQEVSDIFDNPGSSGFWGSIKGAAVDVGQGALKATAIAAENLVPESILGDGGKQLRSFAESLDPKFETEKGLVENLTEGVGQMLPTVAAGLATGGWGGLLVAAGVSTLTNEDENNLANALEEIAPGITPDILVVRPDDDEFTSTSKALVTNIITDAAFMGAFKVAGKALTAFKRGAPVEELKAIAREADSVVDDTAPSFVQMEEISKTAARKRLASQATLRETTGQSVLADAVDPELRKGFHSEVFKSFRKLSERAGDVAEGAAEFRIARKADLVSYADNVLDALSKGDHERLLANLRKGIQANDATEAAYINPFQNAVLKETLRGLNSNFDAAIQAIRQDPTVKTKAAWKQTMSDYQDVVGEIGELYRVYGSSASYQLLDRKGMLPTGGFEEVLEAEKWAKEAFKDSGFDLFSDRIEFVTSQALKWDDLGLDVTKVLPELDDMFSKFDVERQGVLANMRQNSTVKLSPEERTAATASFVRMVKDIQSSALLGQLSTTGLNVISDTLNNVMLPFMEHGLARGNLKRAGTEYAGYAAAFRTAGNIAKKAFVSGKGVLDDFDLMEGAHSSILDYESLAGKPMRHLMVRLFKFATDVSLASSEFWKGTRAFGLAYADGMELAVKSGIGRAEAKKVARQFAQDQFDADGRLVNAMYRNDVAKTSWQQAFDTRYSTGRIAQVVDNARNRDDFGGLMARSAIPFFRTLINIGSDAVQYIVPPGTPAALRAMSKTASGSWLQKVPKTLKALDDFTGANGMAAQARAVGRHRLGMSMTAATLGAVALSDNVEITGASGVQRWDAKKRAFEEFPPNSLIINGVATDMTRLLPFSSPLMLAGMLRDMEIDNQLHMEGGNYSADNSVFDNLVNLAPALVYTSMTLFQDSAAMQGVFDLMAAVDEAMSEDNPAALLRYGQKYAQQFTPGPVKMVAKNINLEQYEGYDFYSAYLASAGLAVGFKRLDFLGEPIVHGVGRGLDPLNLKAIDDGEPVRKEFIFLNKTEGLALVPPRPDAVFDKPFWKRMGVDVGSPFSSGKMPSLVDLKTAEGKNGWDAYREYLYQGRVSRDEKVSTGSRGDRLDIGKVLIMKGENFADAVRRTVEDPTYDRLTPDARKKVWDAIFGHFTKQAKAQLADEVIVKPDVFSGSRYGSPIKEPALLSTTVKAAEKIGAGVQQTRASPLDAAFAAIE